MDWTMAIERNHAALRRIVAMLAAMAGLGGNALTSPLRGFEADLPIEPVARSSAAEGRGDCEAIGVPGFVRGGDRLDHQPEVRARATLPRHLHRAILRLLRPAESATRRLVVIMACKEKAATPQARKGEIATPQERNGGNPTPQARNGENPTPQARASKPTVLRKPGGTGIFVPRIVLPPPLTPPHKKEGDSEASATARPRAPGFPLFDPLRRPFRRRRPVQGSVPRISFPGLVAPSPVRRPPMPGDLLDATRIVMRLKALAAALDDLPAQARRFARWTARRESARTAPGTTRRASRIAPLRRGRPPGSLRRPRHAVHDLLAELHGLALLALERPDTS